MTTAHEVTQQLGYSTETQPRVPPLPSDIAERYHLAWARKEIDGRRPLFAITLSLRESGWSLASIAQPLGVSRETVRYWCNQAQSMDLPRITVPPPPKPAASRAVLAREATELRRLASRDREDAVLRDLLPRLLAVKADAESLRGPGTSNPEKAAASAEYNRLLDEGVRRGVRVSRLADALDVRRVTVYARLRRSGLRDAS